MVRRRDGKTEEKRGEKGREKEIKWEGKGRNKGSKKMELHHYVNGYNSQTRK